MRAWLLAALLYPTLASGAEPLSLKGIAPGMTVEQVDAQHPGLAAKCGVWKDGGSRCTYSAAREAGRSGAGAIPSLTTLAGINVELWLIRLREGKVASVTVGGSSKDFDRLIAAISEKHGKPTTLTESTIQNRAGASFDQVEAQWIIADTSLQIRKRSGNVDRMMVTLGSKTDRELMEKERQENAKKDATDL